MAVLDYGANTYCYLSGSDFRNCIETAGRLVCQKRNIVIKARHECGIKVKNCKVWAKFIVHDLTNTKILIRQPYTASALISCPYNQERKIILPTSAILDLPVSCRLHTANFTISSLEYYHLADYESAPVNISEIDLDIELEFFTSSPNKQLALNLSLTHLDIDKLRQQNADFGKQLKEQEIRQSNYGLKLMAVGQELNK